MLGLSEREVTEYRAGRARRDSSSAWRTASGPGLHGKHTAAFARGSENVALGAEALAGVRDSPCSLASSGKFTWYMEVSHVTRAPPSFTWNSSVSFV